MMLFKNGYLTSKLKNLERGSDEIFILFLYRPKVVLMEIGLG